VVFKSLVRASSFDSETLAEREIIGDAAISLAWFHSAEALKPLDKFTSFASREFESKSINERDKSDSDASTIGDTDSDPRLRLPDAKSYEGETPDSVTSERPEESVADSVTGDTVSPESELPVIGTDESMAGSGSNEDISEIEYEGEIPDSDTSDGPEESVADSVKAR
jgi:hypothetical protein